MNRFGTVRKTVETIPTGTRLLLTWHRKCPAFRRMFLRRRLVLGLPRIKVRGRKYGISRSIERIHSAIVETHTLQLAGLIDRLSAFGSKPRTRLRDLVEVVHNPTIQR